LISNEVTSIVFDPKNRAWFGTTQGISRYDGNRWVTYSSSNSKLAADEVWAIAFDKNDRAWIGTNSGINVFDGNAWTHYRFEEIGFGSPGSKIFLDHLGRIWVQGNYDVSIFAGNKWIGLAEEDGYDNYDSSSATDQKGNLWIANSNTRGLLEFDPDYPFASVWQTQSLRSFLASGGIWYIALILLYIFLAIVRDSVILVALALFAGLVVFIVCAVLLNDVHMVYSLPFMNPGIYATVGAMIGAFAGISRAARTGKPKGSKSTVIGFVMGLAIGICQILPGMLAQ
jgi:two component regulator with propeller domain